MFGQFRISEEFRMAYKMIEGGGNWFVTGKAGTGKTTFIDYFRKKTRKRTAVLAPTGMAAINAGGQTIHSFFKFPPRIITREALARNRTRSELYEDVETIIIDEASMVRADMLDGIDWILRRKRRQPNLAFGGVQIILVGDLFQLPPVVNQEEGWVLSERYESPYFFSAQSYREGDFETIEFGEIYRQKDREFVGFLNKVRWGQIEDGDLSQVNAALIERNVVKGKSVFLTSTNRVAEAINTRALGRINRKHGMYEAKVEGEFPERSGYMPTGAELVLKEGARVMMVKNHKGGEYVNGSLGLVSRMYKDSVWVKLDDRRDEVEVKKDEWEYVKYEANDKGGIDEVVMGKFKQLPLRLAWAITIHKSQGMTFDQVHIDLSRNPFAHGQTYVALSRCRTLKGLSLSRELQMNDVMVDPVVVEFSRSIG